MNEMLPGQDKRLDYPATQRNREAILEVLGRILPETGNVLEIASGSGQHVSFFAKHLTGLAWLPSDHDDAVFDSINAWAVHEGVAERVRPPLKIDVGTAVLPNGPLTAIDAVLSINMVHVAPWSACLGLLENAGRLLPANGVLFLYGPFKIGDRHISESNEQFDMSLREQDREWGVRNLDDVAETALNHGFQLAETVKMPANNFSVIFRRK